jgi:hypothetical protein
VLYSSVLISSNRSLNLTNRARFFAKSVVR